MEGPIIKYGDNPQPLHPIGQYLLMEAGIGNGTMPNEVFLEKIMQVSLNKVREGECRIDVENYRQGIKGTSAWGSTVTIEGFAPDRKSLEKFVNTTFSEMMRELEKKG